MLLAREDGLEVQPASEFTNFTDIDSAKFDRFPPEPNRYLHLGHSKSICLNFGVAEDYTEFAI